MAARKKTTEEKNEQQAAATPTEQTFPGQKEGHVEDAREQTPETVDTPEAAPSVPERSEDDCAPQEAGQPRSGSEALSMLSPSVSLASSATAAASAQNASDSECRTGMCDRASSGLLSLSVLADRHRVQSWQQAALSRFMGWADGKMLTDDEYRAALAGLTARHLGGGRRK